MKTLIVILAITASLNAHSWGFNVEKETTKNEQRTDRQVCDKLRGYMEWSTYDGAGLMRDELEARGYLTPREARGLLHGGYASTGYTGFSVKALDCRFDLTRESTSQSGSRRYEWWTVYNARTDVRRILSINGVIESTYDY